jgi:hypothetical protein
MAVMTDLTTGKKFDRYQGSIKWFLMPKLKAA